MPTTHCLRCQTPCQTGTPDPNAKVIVVAKSKGLCANCMITLFLLSVEPIRDTINGTPARGDLVAARPGKGPEILLGLSAPKAEPWVQQVKSILTGILNRTQMREDQIDWIEVVGNWGLPWPRGFDPEKGAWF